MAAIPEDYTLTATGDYDVPLAASLPYLVTMGTSNAAGSAATISFPIGAAGAYVAVDDNGFLGSDPMSRRFVAPANTMRITVGTYTTPIKVSVLNHPAT